MLEEFLVSNIFAVLLVFTRVGSGLMAMPGFGETYVSMRIRLGLAFALAVLTAPIVANLLPPPPDSPVTLTILLMSEVFIGVAIGMVCRVMIATMHIAGMMISMQSGLAMATQFDASQASQGSIIGSMLSITAVVLIFSLNLHHIMLRGLTDSYQLFAVGSLPPVEDFAFYFAKLVSAVFLLAFKLASPVIVIGLLLYLGAGVLARLMPNMQVFFILLPPQVFIGLFMLMSVFAAIMFEFSDFYTDTLYEFLSEM